MKTAFSYIRFSTREQRKGDSQRRQTEKTLAYCQKHKLKLDDSLSLRDLGVSAFKGKNLKDGALGAFLRAVEDGIVRPGSVLIVESLDRISRQQIVQAQTLFLQIISGGIEIVTLLDEKSYTEESVNTEPLQMIYSLTIMMRAHEESDTKSKRVAAAWKRKRESAEKRPLTHKCPTWLRLDGEKFKVIPERKTVLLRMVKEATEGVGSMRIAKALNRDAVETFGRGNSWDAGTVNAILRSRALVGEYQPCSGGLPAGEPVKNYYPRILSDQQFNGLQGVLDSRKTNIVGRQGERMANLFGRALRSGWDGSQFVLHRAHKKKVIISMDAVTGAGKGETSAQTFPYDALEQHFLLWISEIDLSDQKRESKVEEISARLNDVRTRLANGQDELAKAGNFAEGFAVIQKIKDEETAIAAELETERHASAAPLLVDSQRDIDLLIDQLSHATGEKRLAYRTRLRTRLNLICKQIVLRVVGNQWKRLALVEVELTDGTWRYMAIRRVRGEPAQSMGALQALPKRSCNWKRLGERLLEDFHPTEFAGALDVAVATVLRPAMEPEEIVTDKRGRVPMAAMDNFVQRHAKK